MEKDSDKQRSEKITPSPINFQVATYLQPPHNPKQAYVTQHRKSTLIYYLETKWASQKQLCCMQLSQLDVGLIEIYAIIDLEIRADRNSTFLTHTHTHELSVVVTLVLILFVVAVENSANF